MIGYETKAIRGYTADQAVADGTLFKVDAELCRRAGFAIPVRITVGAKRLVAPKMAADEESVEDRLWDTLSMARIAICNSRSFDTIACFDVQFGEGSVRLLACLDTTSGPAIHLTTPEEHSGHGLYNNGCLGQPLYLPPEQ